MSNNRYGGVDSYAAFFIGYKARTLTKSPFFTADDFEDLQQELMLAYLHAWPSFDETKGDRRSFIKSVINNHAINLIAEAETQKRWTGQKELSLSTIIGDEESSMELLDSIASEQALWGDSFASNSYMMAEYNMDMSKVLADMPEDIRCTYELLKYQSITEASHSTGIPRTTLSSRAKKLREYLEKLGLRE